jgi:hypothetical protein
MTISTFQQIAILVFTLDFLINATFFISNKYFKTNLKLRPFTFIFHCSFLFLAYSPIDYLSLLPGFSFYGIFYYLIPVSIIAYIEDRFIKK